MKICQGHCLEVSWSTRNGSLPPSGSQLTDFKLFTSVLFHFSFIMCFSLSVFALWFLSGICSVCSPHFPISNCWHLLCMILHLKWLPTWQMKCNKSLLFLSTGNLCRLCKRDSQRFHRVTCSDSTFNRKERASERYHTIYRLHHMKYVKLAKWGSTKNYLERTSLEPASNEK